MSLLTKEQLLDFEKEEGFNSIFKNLLGLFQEHRLSEIDIIPLINFVIKSLEFDNPYSVKLSDLESVYDCDTDWIEFASLDLTEEIWAKSLKIVLDPIIQGEYTVQELKLFSIRFYGMELFTNCDMTPKSLTNLANSILDIQPEEKVADIGCGTGSFIMNAWKKQDKAYYFGCDEFMPYIHCNRMITSYLDGNFDFTPEDAFELVHDSSMKFDKIFSNYPLKVKISDLYYGEDYLASLRERIPSISKATTSDWLYNSLLCDLLNENGKAVAIMTNGSTWNRTDKAVRQYFIENGLVEAVISLPPKLLGSSTAISTSMIILSKGNDSVRIVDATNFFEPGRRANILSDENIDTIISALKEDGQYSISISKEELRNNEYNLNFNRYVKHKLLMENMVDFELVIKNITRGASIKAEDLDKITTNEVTNKNYLMIGNIQDGIIDEELPYISVIEKNLEKYCLKRNNLVFSKNGFPFKIAVATPKEGQQILANGNLFIIEIDEEKANPYYLKSFFESEQGISSLKSIVVGSTIPNIGVESLKSLKIPLPSINEQNKIAEKYQATQDEVKILKLRLAKTLDRLYHTFDEDDCNEEVND